MRSGAAGWVGPINGLSLLASVNAGEVGRLALSGCYAVRS
jgi:hypothetical protein